MAECEMSLGQHVQRQEYAVARSERTGRLEPIMLVPRLNEHAIFMKGMTSELVAEHVVQKRKRAE